jgi:hypothetical protein
MKRRMHDFVVVEKEKEIKRKMHNLTNINQSCFISYFLSRKECMILLCRKGERNESLGLINKI